MVRLIFILMGELIIEYEREIIRRSGFQGSGLILMSLGVGYDPTCI
jgi:hypothetical protein